MALNLYELKNSNKKTIFELKNIIYLFIKFKINMDINTKDVIVAIIGFIAGASISIPITIKVVKSKFSDSNNVSQKIIKTKGDVVGRDKIGL